QRGHEPNARGAIKPGKCRVAIGTVDVTDRRPVCLTVLAVDTPCGRSNGALDVGIFRDLGTAFGRYLQVGDLAPPVGLRLEQSLECGKSMRNPFRIIQAVDPDDEYTIAQALDHTLDERQLYRTLGKMGERRSLDTDRKYADPHRSVGDDEIEVAAVQAAFPRKITAEIEGVVAGLKADEIVFAERWNETLVIGQRREHFRRRARNVEEKADAISVPALAQRFGEGHQVIIMHPDDIVRPEQLFQVTREVIVDADITAQIASREFSEVDAIVQDRP